MSLQTGPALAYATFNGRNGAGAISVPGTKVGDLVVFIVRTSSGADYTGVLEGIVTVADQIQQWDTSDLSAVAIQVAIVRPTI